MSSYGASASAARSIYFGKEHYEQRFRATRSTEICIGSNSNGRIRNVGLRIPGLDVDGVNLHLPIADTFPGQPAEIVREMVTVSHFDLKRVKELVESRPSLAKACWDWGFGDWESAIGCGVAHGKSANGGIFDLERRAAFDFFRGDAWTSGSCEGVCGGAARMQRIRGPHGISLLAHAKNGGAGARNVYDFLQSLGDADVEPEVPIADEEKTKLLGTYTFGIGVTQQVEVLMQQSQGMKTGVFTWMRKGAWDVRFIIWVSGNFIRQARLTCEFDSPKTALRW